MSTVTGTNTHYDLLNRCLARCGVEQRRNQNERKWILPSNTALTPLALALA